MPRYRYTTAQLVELLREMPEQDRARVDKRAARDLDPRYVEHGEPCCLVAHLLLQVGVPVHVLKALDLEAGTGSATPKLRESRHPFWGRFEPAARSLLDFLQFVQDYGRPWGEVAREALEPRRLDDWRGGRWDQLNPGGRPWLAAIE